MEHSALCHVRSGSTTPAFGAGLYVTFTTYSMYLHFAEIAVIANNCSIAVVQVDLRQHYHSVPAPKPAFVASMGSNPSPYAPTKRIHTVSCCCRILVHPQRVTVQRLGAHGSELQATHSLFFFFCAERSDELCTNPPPTNLLPNTPRQSESRLNPTNHWVQEPAEPNQPLGFAEAQPAELFMAVNSR